MKFIKGVMIGGLITTGLVMMYSETGMLDKKMMMKKIYINFHFKTFFVSLKKNVKKY